MSTRVDLTALTVDEVDHVFAQLGAGVPEGDVLAFVQETTRTRLATAAPILGRLGAFDLSHLMTASPDTPFWG